MLSDKVTMDAPLPTEVRRFQSSAPPSPTNAQRADEYKLREMWKSPNGTIRAVLDGTVFRAPIMIDSIKPVVRNWKSPSPLPATPTARAMYKVRTIPHPGCRQG